MYLLYEQYYVYFLVNDWTLSPQLVQPQIINPLSLCDLQMT